MPAGGYRQGEMDLLAVLKALGDETRFAMYRELARSTAALSRPGARRAARPPRQHRAPAPRAAARGRPGRRRGRPPGHRRAARSTSTRSPPARPGSGSTRRATRCSPGCSPRWPSGSAPTPTTPPTTGPGLGRRGRAPHPVAQLPQGARGASSTGSASSPRSKPTTAPTAPPASSSSTARSGSWPRPTPSWCATSTGGSARAWSTRSAGEAVEEFATLYDPDPCRVVVAVGYPDSRPVHGEQRSDVHCSGRQHRLHLTDAAADKVKS